MIAAAVLLGFVAWLLVGGEDDEQPPAAPTGIVSRSELAEFAADREPLIYWAGLIPGTKMLLMETPEGTQVRYLRNGNPAEEELTVGTYPSEGAARQLEEFAATPEAIVRSGTAGRKVVTSRKQRTSIYFLSADGDAQVEVYSPLPAFAMELARSLRVRPVGR